MFYVQDVIRDVCRQAGDRMQGKQQDSNDQEDGLKPNNTAKLNTVTVLCVSQKS